MPNGAQKSTYDGVKYHYIPFPSKEKVKRVLNSAPAYLPRPNGRGLLEACRSKNLKDSCNKQHADLKEHPTTSYIDFIDH
jgi:hypothetical protein